MEQPSHEIGRIHIVVTGRVQGVGFRAFVQQTAEKLGLKGWVRNSSRDQVETIAEGNSQSLNQFLESVTSGPRSARVNETQFEWQKPTGEHISFEIRF